MNIILKKYGIFIVAIIAVLVLGIKFIIPPFETYFTAHSKVADKKEKIEHIYYELNDLILDYDREKIDDIFKAKAR